MRRTNPVKSAMVVPQKLKMLKFLSAKFIGTLESKAVYNDEINSTNQRNLH